MGKRSNFERKPRDFYPTPYEAVVPLLPHLSPRTYFMEPCAGNGALVNHLRRHGHHCFLASDIEPQHDSVSRIDALQMTNPYEYLATAHDNGCIITNPPWSRDVLHQMIDKFTMHTPAWLLIDASWAFTQQAVPYMERCSKFVAIGRVKWEEGSKHTGKDDAAWYKFHSTRHRTIFYSKLPKD